MEIENGVGNENTDEDHIKVCVRIRPMLRDEASSEQNAWSWDHNTISQETVGNARRKSTVIGVSGRSSDDGVPNAVYTFDYLFKPEQTNEHIFTSVVENIVDKSMHGFHGSVFTYGQTSSGKTFTMTGTSTQPGIIPQAICLCFDSIQKFPDREFLFRVSYLEVYNEQVKDLLSTEPTQIKIQHGAKVGTVLSGVKEQVVLNPQQVMALLKAGEAHRHVGSTDMNEKSSRAHTLFKLIIESKETGGSNVVRVSTLSLVDLAGSENAKMTNSSGDRAKEAKYINTSLLTLSTIIQRLSEEEAGSSKQRQHLPYRDSKLTRLMQPSLSGNSHIAVICTISPTARCAEESHNTLKFAVRAKRVKVDAKVNEQQDDKTLLRAYRMEIEELKARLRAIEAQNKAGGTATGGPGVVEGAEGGPLSSASDSNTSRTDGGFDDGIGQGDEEVDFVLQMIAEMERLILKADVPKGGPLAGGDGAGDGSPGGASVNKKKSRGAVLVDGPTAKGPAAGEASTKGITPSSSASSARPKVTGLANPSTVAAAGPGSDSGSSTPTTLESAAASSSKAVTGVSGSKARASSLSSSSSSSRLSSGSPNTHVNANANLNVNANPSGNSSGEDRATGVVSSGIAKKASQLSSFSTATTLPNTNANASASASTDKRRQTSKFGFVHKPSEATQGPDGQKRRGSQFDVDTVYANTEEGAGLTAGGGGDASEARGREREDSTNPMVARKRGGVVAVAWQPVNADAQGDGTEGKDVSAAGARDGVRGGDGEGGSTEDSTPSTPSGALSHAAGAGAGDEEGGADGGGQLRVLLTVGKMLAMLKQRVEKTPRRISASSSSSLNSATASTSQPSTPPPPSSTSTNPGALFPSPVMDEYSHPMSAWPTSEGEGSVSGSTSVSMSMSASASLSPMPPREEEDSYLSFEDLEQEIETHKGTIHALRTALELKAADNHFLQDELDKKDQMMVMLTEGLREVEVNQQNWLQENDLLSRELEGALQENEMLRAEVGRLQASLELRERQLFEATGVPPESEEF